MTARSVTKDPALKAAEGIVSRFLRRGQRQYAQNLNSLAAQLCANEGKMELASSVFVLLRQAWKAKMICGDARGSYWPTKSATG